MHLLSQEMRRSEEASASRREFPNRCRRNAATWCLPPEPTDVRDVCGAGDTVLAASGAAMPNGDSLHEACRFALSAASQQVAHFGISTVAAKVTALPHSFPELATRFLRRPLSGR